MDYQNIWSKILNPEEKIIVEFTLGRQYISLRQITIGLFGLMFLPLSWIIFLIFCLLAIFSGWYLRKANAYAFSDQRVLIHRGWLSTHLISIDYDKITDVSVIEPLFDRLLCKTGYIAINTAGTTFYEVILKNVEKPYELKKQLDKIRTKTI